MRFPQNFTPPEFYCLPKTHKTGVPFRPVVSNIHSVTSELAKWISRILFPLVGNRNSTLKNSLQLRQELKTLRIANNEILVSFDVENLFTNVPVEYTIGLTEKLLNEDKDLSQRTAINPSGICQLIKLCLVTGNFFRFQGTFYRQLKGVPMGSPLSPVIAEIFMEHLEEKAFHTAGLDLTPRFFKRYVDDILAICQDGKEKLFLNTLNEVFKGTVSFTMERENEGKMPFLDILMYKNRNRLETSVYRKPTHSDRYLHFDSYHADSVKIGLVNTLVDRAFHICDRKYRPAELRHILETLCNNGYPRTWVTRKISQRLRWLKGGCLKKVSLENETSICIPYNKILSKRLQKRLFGKCNVYHQYSTSIRNILRSDKTAVPMREKRGWIYQIICSCKERYIGETGGTLEERFLEHMAALKRYTNAKDRSIGVIRSGRGRPPKLDPVEAMEAAKCSSAVVEHYDTCRAEDRNFNIFPISRETDFEKRRTKEALAIRRHACYNRDNGLDLSDAWHPFINLDCCPCLPTRTANTGY